MLENKNESSSIWADRAFGDIEELEAALRARYVKVKTMTRVNTELSRLRMRAGEQLSDFAKLRDERIIAVTESFRRHGATMTQEIRNREDETIIDGFILGLNKDELRMSMRSEYGSLEEAVSHAEEIALLH